MKRSSWKYIGKCLLFTVGQTEQKRERESLQTHILIEVQYFSQLEKQGKYRDSVQTHISVKVNVVYGWRSREVEVKDGGCDNDSDDG